jgi:hypothetical protein
MHRLSQREEVVRGEGEPSSTGSRVGPKLVRTVEPVHVLTNKPVRCGRPALLAALLFLPASFFVCDPPPGALEVLLLHAFEEAQQVETGRATVRLFDCRR